MRRLLLRLLINAVALWAAARWVPGIAYEGDWGTLAAVALIFGLVNALIRPLLKLLTSPLIAATLGLFTLVINALMLWLTAALAQSLGVSFSVAGFGSALLGAIVISLVSLLLTLFLGDDKQR